MFDEVASLIHDLDMGMLPISVLAPYLPIPAHRRRDQCASCLPVPAAESFSRGGDWSSMPPAASLNRAYCS